MTQKISSRRHHAADEHPASQATPASKIVAPHLDPNFGPAFFGTAPRADIDDKTPKRKIDAQEFWRRLDP